MDKIEARLLKGFRDFSPKEQEKRQDCMHILQEVFKQSGFLAIDTPVLEYEEILLGKGGGETDKQIYRFEDKGKRKVVMRFDLTVPFARYVAMNAHNLPKPFLRYQIGKVFRGENTQKGRYREFIQCDFDAIGADHTSLDFTIVQTIVNSFNALNIPQIKIHISHRGLLNEILAKLAQKNKAVQANKEGIASDVVDISAETLRIIDKIRKIGKDATVDMLKNFWEPHHIEQIINFVMRAENNERTLDNIITHVGKDSPSFARLQEIYRIASALGFAEKIVIDPSITRGLDYYTDFVFETFVQDYEDVGSVCSGGRYNNLTKMFSDEEYAGVGASIGLDRLLAILEEAGAELSSHRAQKIVIMTQTEGALAYCHQLQQALIENNFSAHVYPLCDTPGGKMKQFFKYSEKVESDFLFIIGSEELECNTVTVKHQATRTQLTQVKLEETYIWMENLR